MALPDFAFEPCEAGQLASGEPLCAPATRRIVLRRWKGEAAYLARTAKHRDGSLCTWGKRDEAGAPVIQLRFDFAALNRGWKHIPWTRVLGFNAQMNLARHPSHIQIQLYLQNTTRDFFPEYLASWDEDYSSRFRFAFRLKPIAFWPQIDRIHATHIQTFVKQDLAEPDSDCSFALRWMTKGDTTRLRYLCATKRGSFDELETCLRHLALTDARFKEGTLLWQPKFTRRETLCASVLSAFPLKMSAHVEINGAPIPLLVEQRCILKIMESYFQPYRMKLKRDSPELIGSTILHPEISIDSPSRHERLEARLQLREWLRDKVSPEELDSLL